MGEPKLTLSDRLIAFLVSVFAMALSCVVLGVGLLFTVGPQGFGLAGFWPGFAWAAVGACLAIGIAGFILGVDRISLVFGSLWRSNKPSNGDWL